MNRITQRVAEAGAGLVRVRWLVRAPIWLYRARLGFLFGERLLMLEHTGRKSGLLRLAVLEIVARPAPDRYIVASAFGTRAQWFRNVRANPQVRLYLGSHRPRAAMARVLTSDQSSTALAEYAATHPRAWQMLRPVLETLRAHIDDQTTPLPLIALDLTPQVH
ncbi:MAG: nitroreductase family deazaflavin-dependent oxidoreductase [Terrimesophilobacter sp.]